MRKTTAAVATSLCLTTLIGVASAQTPAPTSTAPQGTTLAGEVIAVVAVIVIFAVIAYAGYKMIRKWSSPGSE